MDKVSVAVITNRDGAHLSAYYGALAEIDAIESVVIADDSRSTLSLAEKTLGRKLIRSYTNTEMMFAETAPAMVLVSLESGLAPAAIRAALTAGHHVLSEKPACLDAEDFAALVTLADSKHQLLMLALANRLNSPVQEARRLTRSGLFGRIYGMELHIIADQTRLTRPEYHQTWYASKARAGGGHLIWLGIHWLDLATFITGLTAREVCALTANVGEQPLDVEDSAAVIIRYDNGSLATMTSGYYLDKGYHTHLKIWGEYGWLSLSGMETGPLEYYSSKAGQPGTVQTFQPLGGQGGYTPFVEAAYRAATGQSPAPITGQEGLQALRTVYASYQAASTGMRQEIPR